MRGGLGIFLALASAQQVIGGPLLTLNTLLLLLLHQYVYERMAAARSCALQVRHGGARPGQACGVNQPHGLALPVLV